jgi:hypothetical protein
LEKLNMRREYWSEAFDRYWKAHGETLTFNTIAGTVKPQDAVKEAFRAGWSAARAARMKPRVQARE